MQKNQVNAKSDHHTTKFTAMKCDSTQDALNFFGNYSPDGHTILVVMPERGSCKPWITIPDGTIAVVTKNGEFMGYWESGIHFCLPWTEATYLVTRQNIVFKMPVSTSPTSDNIFVDIHVSVVLQIQPEHQYVHQLCMNINELNQMLEAAITERVRTMVRSVRSKNVYSIRGAKHATQMKNYLRDVMATKGINVKEVIITNVKLPFDVANSLQEKTIFQFKNAFERKKQSFELRTINDKEELEILKSKRNEERKDEVERAELEQAEVRKQIERIKATRIRHVAEINEKTKALSNQIRAETDVKYNEIIAEANLIETEIVAQARLDAAKIKAEADAYFMKTVSTAQQKNAQMISEAIALEGQAESQMNKGFKRRRKHLQIMARLSSLDSLARNKRSIIFGDQGDNLMGNLEAYNMVFASKKKREGSVQ